MSESAIDVCHLTKRFGSALAVDDLSFTAAPGRVTGFLGPNGSGKPTTLRVLLGLASATSGRATVNSRPYAELARPARVVGAAIEHGFHPACTARHHLQAMAIAAEVSLTRVDDVLALVGLTDDARRRVGQYSLGMRQRLMLATALLGDPEILDLDEPSNGLDPDGIVWLRVFCARWPRKAAPCCCPAMRWPRSGRRSTTSS